MNLSGKLILAATLVDRLAERDIRAGAVTSYAGTGEVSLIVHGDQATVLRAGELLDTRAPLILVGDIQHPLGRVTGTLDGVQFSITSSH